MSKGVTRTGMTLLISAASFGKIRKNSELKLDACCYFLTKQELTRRNTGATRLVLLVISDSFKIITVRVLGIHDCNFGYKNKKVNFG